MDSQLPIDLSSWPVRVVIAFILATIFTVLTSRSRRRIQFLERENNRLRELAETDSMTDLRSRRWFDENYQRFVARANEGLAYLGIVLVDINKFKRVNDTYGHPSGDAVICAVARALEMSCRPGDVIVRYGGEEFAMVLEGATSEVVDRISREAERAIRNTDILLPTDDVITVTASFGGISRKGPGLNGAKLVEHADRRLYRAKELQGSGDWTVVVSSERQRAPRLPEEEAEELPERAIR